MSFTQISAQFLSCLLGIFAGIGIIHIIDFLKFRNVNKTLRKVNNILAFYAQSIEENIHFLEFFKSLKQGNDPFEEIVSDLVYHFFNTLGYLLHAGKDFISIYGAYLSNVKARAHESHLEFTMRILALQIHEFCTKINKAVLNHKFQAAIVLMEKTFGAEDVITLLDSIKNKQKEFNKKTELYRSYIKDVRDSIGAHRDPDVLAYVDQIKKLDHKKIIELSNQTLFFANDISKKLLELETKVKDKVRAKLV